jgi:hypothetical protein
MIKKFRFIFCTLFLFFGFSSLAQDKYEREHRILKSQFPEKAIGYIQDKLVDAKRIRFYKEIDNAKINYEVKFKKDRLWYSVAFDKEGALTSAEIRIKPIDIPEESFSKINSYLATNFSKYRIRRFQQQYPITTSESAEKTIKNAFQNMMIPNMNYELFVKGTTNGARSNYDITFDSYGNFIQIKKALPANYGRVLY